MRAAVPSILVLALLALPEAAAQAPASKQLIAVLPLNVRDAQLSPAARVKVEESIRTAAGDALARQGFNVLTGDNTLKVLRDNGIDAERACEAACAVDMGKELKARYVISGIVATEDGIHTAFVRLYDVSTGSLLSSIKLRGKNGNELEDAFDQKARELFEKSNLLPPAGAPAAAPAAAPAQQPAPAPLAQLPQTPGMSPAVARLQDECGGGDDKACFDLALRFAKGEGVQKDAGRAGLLHAQTCERGYLASCGSASWHYRNGEGVPKDAAYAVTLARKGCDGGQMRACWDLGLAYDFGAGVEKDAVRALALHTKACEGNYHWSCNDVGLAYRDGTGVAQDHPRAARLFRTACDADNGHACFNLGKMLNDGLGMEADPAAAAPLYRKACDAGHATACNNLGVAYFYGRGVETDEKRAYVYFNQACKGGEQKGCENAADEHTRNQGGGGPDAGICIAVGLPVALVVGIVAAIMSGGN